MSAHRTGDPTPTDFLSRIDVTSAVCTSNALTASMSTLAPRCAFTPAATHQQARCGKGSSSGYLELWSSVQTCNQERSLQRTAEIDKIRLDKTWGLRPGPTELYGARAQVRQGTIGGTTAIAFTLSEGTCIPVEPKCRVPLSIVSDSDRCQGIVPRKPVVEHAVHAWNIVILNRQIWPRLMLTGSNCRASSV